MATESRGERRFHHPSALLHESVRRATFSSWKIPFLDPDELADAGFFYLRTADHVQCVMCQGIVGYWDPGDKPLQEHQKHFPNCQLISGVCTGNIPKNKAEDQHGQLFKLLDEYYYFRVHFTKPYIKMQSDSVNMLEGLGPSRPELNTTESRLCSFKRWPKDVDMKPEALAEAGFYSIGISDWVQCFHCAGGIFNWSSHDNPWHDHARLYPHCTFVRMQLGEEKVISFWENKTDAPGNQRSLKLNSEEAELVLSHPIAQRLVTMGLSKRSVRSAIVGRIEKHGLICRSVTEALELVFDQEEELRKKELKEMEERKKQEILNQKQKDSQEKLENMESVDLQQTNSNLHKDSTISHSEEVAEGSHDGSPFLSSSPEMNKLFQEVQDLRAKVTQVEKLLVCRCCQKEQVAVVFQPCSHLHLCTSCARPRDTCYTCNAVIRATLKPIISNK
ncbi:unnamed protein product [Meganyctiphanes norvegica]|uniref:Uncharacterized protein n=1 Tax=Meganyctiphanes norvegica TaxID=48144 RepID=A0AAV2S6G6_MEGNR